MRRARGVLLRLLLHRLALVVALLTTLLTTSLLAALATFTVAVADQAVATTVTASPAAQVSVTGSVTYAGLPRADRVVRGVIGGLLPGRTIWTSMRSDFMNIPVGYGGPNGQTQVISLASLSRHAVLLAGAWPGAPGRTGPVAVAVPAEVAAVLHLHPGSELTLHASVTGAPLVVTVSGIVRRLQPASAYWSFDRTSPRPYADGGFTIYGDLIASPAAFTDGRVQTVSASWSARPDVNRIPARQLESLSVRLQSALSRVGGTAGLGDVEVSTGLPGLLAGLSTALLVARSQLAIGVLVLLLLVGATLALTSALLGQQRRGEAVLLRARGASRWQMLGTGAAEGLLLAVPAAVAGPVIGGLALPWLARWGPLARTGLRLHAGYPAVAWLAAGVAAAGCAVIIAAPWARRELSPGAQRGLRSRQRAVSAVSRAGADLALVALAALAAGQIGTGSEPVATGLSGALGVDPVLVCAPVLALAAGAALTLRLLPVVSRIGDVAAARGSSLVGAVAAWQISRRPLRQAGPVLLAVLGVATTVIAVSQWSSWQRSAHDRAAFDVGADRQLDLPAAAPLPIGQVATLTRARGVLGATPVLTYPIGLPDGGSATLLALDGRVASSVAEVRPDLAGGSPAAMLAGLTPGTTPGAVIAGAPARLAITAALGPSSIQQAELTVQLTDAAGIPYLLPVGQLPANGKDTSFTVTVAAANQADYPLRVTGLTLQYQMPLEESEPVTLAIVSVRPAATMTSGFGPPVDLAGLARGFVGQAVADSGGVSAGGATSAEPEVEQLLPGPPTALQVAFSSGTGNNALTFGGTPGSIGASISVLAGPQPGPLPAAATASYLKASGQRPGDTVAMTVNGLTVPFKIVREVSEFPTITGTYGGLIVDQAALQEAMTTAGAQPQPVSQWWLRTGPAVRLPALPPGTSQSDSATIAQALLTDPLAAAPQQAMLAIAAAAVLLACLGFVVSVATASERARDLALLRTMGASRRQLVRLACLEQLLLTLPGALIGLLLGGLLAHLVVPAMSVTSSGSAPEPPVLVQVPWTVPLLLAAAIVAVPVLTVAASLRGDRRMAVRLRTEELA